jgi:hypothetical protein
MGRHRKSKKNVVQVTPDATYNYISGILTGANNYIIGLLEGSNLYNSWVTQEMTLEGTEIGEYKPDSLRKYLEMTKNVNPTAYSKFITDPYAYYMSLNENEKKNFINEILTNTNYGRLAKVDKAMIKAGNEYRNQIASLIKGKNIQSGLTALQNYAPSSTQVIDKINGLLTSSIKVE